MAKALLIAEKNSMCEAIRSAMSKVNYKDTIDYETFAGHVVRQKQPGEYKEEWKRWTLDTLPMIPDKIEFVKDEDKAYVFDRLKRVIENGNYDYLICATDAAREGNLIFAAFYEVIGCTLPVKRFFNNSLTEETIQKDMNNLLEWDTGRMYHLTQSAYLRSYFDSLFGYNTTRAYTLAKGFTKPCNIGRVLTVVTRLVVDRELEIRNFKSEKYFNLNGIFTKDSLDINTTALDEDGRVLSFKTKKEMQDFIKALNGKHGKVTSTKKTLTKSTAPELFSLGTLQTTANAEFGYTLKQTLDIAQTLYENKWISYPRTESTHVTVAVSNTFKTLLDVCKHNPEYGKFVDGIEDEFYNKAIKNSKYVDDSKVSDHYALLPTEVVPDYFKMSSEQKNIYGLIVRQFVAIFYKPLAINKSEITIDVDSNLFIAKGSILEDKGYTVLFNKSFTDNELPQVNEGDIVDAKEYAIIEKKTTAPKRYTEGTLNTAMENANRFVEDDEEKQVLKKVEGIGKPSTRAAIIEKCIAIQFLERKRSSLVPSEFAIEMIQDIKGEDFVSPSLTAQWEQKLQDVEDGQLSYDTFYKEMIQYITEETERLSNYKGGDIVDKNSLGICPLCGKNVVATDKYYKCINYKGGTDESNPCSFIIGKDFFGTKISEKNAIALIKGEEVGPFKMKSKEGKEYSAKLVYNKDEQRLNRVFENSNSNGEVKVQEKTGEKCPKCGSDMVLRHGKFGEFEACSNYPTCKYIKPKNGASTVEKTGEKCPHCGHDMVLRHGKYGDFEACSNYPTCKYIKKNK